MSGKSRESIKGIRQGLGQKRQGRHDRTREFPLSCSPPSLASPLHRLPTHSLARQSLPLRLLCLSHSHPPSLHLSYTTRCVWPFAIHSSPHPLSKTPSPTLLPIPTPRSQSQLPFLVPPKWLLPIQLHPQTNVSASTSTPHNNKSPALKMPLSKTTKLASPAQTMTTTKTSQSPTRRPAGARSRSNSFRTSPDVTSPFPSAKPAS